MGELGLTLVQLYNLTWKEFSLKCQGLLMKYQRLAVLTRQLAAFIVNSTPGIEEAVTPEQLFKTAFDNLERYEMPAAVPPEEWEKEQKRLNALFDKMSN